MSRGCSPEKGGRRPEKGMTRTCAEQGTKQAPSAKKDKLEAVAAAKWSRNICRYGFNVMSPQKPCRDI